MNQRTITCVLGNQTYETLEIRDRKLLVIHGEAAGTYFSIIPGWYSGNERYDKGQLAAIDVELVDPVEQMNLESEIRARLEAHQGKMPRISFWGSRVVDEIEGGDAESSTILVVDDDPTIRDIIEKYLEREGYGVKTAASSREAETILKTSKLPQLMLLDIMMPGGTGWQLLKELEKDENVRRLPVVAISGLERPSETSNEYDSKMLYDYLVKPFSLAELSAVVKKFKRPG
ncbi:MAG: response regulator [Nitrososphaerales archaeon]